MKILGRCFLGILWAALPAALGCGRAAPSATPPQVSPPQELVGAWRSRIRFRGGPFAEMKDLEFLYVFNAGGTLTESSNYDGAPPVPPAYGIWRQTGPRQYELRYSFYVTKPPASFDDLAKGGGWLPAGRGDFAEKITLSDDGKTYKSTIAYAPFDLAGRPAEGDSKADGDGVRMEF
jgi:hypothetical protein